ncbi:MAG: hypothetical protein M3072_03965 [Candidatus Dormibacteraeota bacterium]|nr:hypothetical protein [Candidatus Dormibacteraeota bacterium]
MAVQPGRGLLGKPEQELVISLQAVNKLVEIVSPMALRLGQVTLSLEPANAADQLLVRSLQPAQGPLLLAPRPEHVCDPNHGTNDGALGRSAQQKQMWSRR